MKPAILTHGGAGAWERLDEEPVLEGMRQATVVGWEILTAGGSALDAVEKATNVLEDNPLFDAGVGGFLNDQGEVQLDALIVDGSTLNFGAVAAVQHVRHPISLARLIMTKTPHCFIVGEGADRIAAELGMPLEANIALVTPENLEIFRKHNEQGASATGTVGAVAIDSHGHVASATSTGGTINKRQGRVGDSPMFGAGGYADDRFGAASTTGEGEYIMRVLLSHYAVDQLGFDMTAQEAAMAASHHILGRFETLNCGIIVVDKFGRIGASHTSPYMPIGWIDAEGAVQASTGKGIEGFRSKDTH